MSKLHDKIVDEIVSIVNGKLSVNEVDLGTLFYYPKDSILYKQFQELINRLSRDNVEAKYDDIDGNIILDSSLCKGEIVLEYKDERISKLEILPLLNRTNANSIDNWDDLVQCFEKLNIIYGLGYRSQNGEYLFSGKDILAVASLQKILVVYAVYKCVEDGCFDWTDSVNISDKQISNLSLGINSVGSYPIKDLLARAIIASDNTAADALLRKVNEFTIGSNLCSNVVSNKGIYENSVEISEGFVNNKIQWINGIDHFLSIRDISEKWMKIANMSWVPLDEIETVNKEGFIFKGGRAPGVFSGSWSLRNGFKNLTFAVNSVCSLTILDEIYILRACTSFIQGQQEGK